MSDILTRGEPGAPTHLILAHGAGAGMATSFMEAMSALLVERGLLVSRFEFAYMAARVEGKRRPPPKAETLIPEFRAIVERVAAAAPAGQKLLIGGKSMGGRVASYVADEMPVAGLVCLGYPFHPPGKPEQLRTAHLETLQCPALVVQGERDPFGSRVEVEALRLSPAIRLAWIGDGDHDFGPRGGSGFTRRGNLAAAADAVRTFADAPVQVRSEA